MKKGKITLGIVLGLLVIGFVVAQAQSNDAGSAAVEQFTLRNGGVFSVDMIGYCNDVEFAYQSLGNDLFALNGQEYGCGADERLSDGTMRYDKSSNTLYLAYTTITSYSYSTPRIGQFNVQIDLGTLSGPAQFAYHYEGYHDGACTATIGGKSLVESDEPDFGE